MLKKECSGFFSALHARTEIGKFRSFGIGSELVVLEANDGPGLGTRFRETALTLDQDRRNKKMGKAAAYNFFAKNKTCAASLELNVSQNRVMNGGKCLAGNEQPLLRAKC